MRLTLLTRSLEQVEARSSSTQDQQMVKCTESDTANSSAEVARIMSKKGVEVSSRTVRRRLRENDFYFGRQIKKPLLAKIHIERRLTWAHANKDRDWTRVIFSDESTFVKDYQVKGVWKKKGEFKVIRTVKHSAKVNMWGCFSSKGFGRLVIIVGILESKQMVEIYKKGLLPSANKFYGRNSRDWVLVEDGDPKHRSNFCKNWKAQHGIQVLEWPPQSPDCNPIENVWALLKARLARQKFASLDDLIKGIQREWARLPIEYAQNLAESCARRCEVVIKQRGEWIPY